MSVRKSLPRYCTWNRCKPGVWLIRFRRRGFEAYLGPDPDADDFDDRYAAALSGAKLLSGEIGRTRTKPGSIDALIAIYYSSPEFRSLAKSTQTTYRGILERFRREHGTKPLRGIERHHVKALIGAKAATPAAANNLLRMLRLLFAFAVDIGWLNKNPALAVKGFRRDRGGFHTWSEAEIAQYRRFHAIGTKPRAAFEILLGTAARRSDAVRLGWQHVDGHWLVMRQQKTGHELRIPVHPELQLVLDATPRTNMTFLLTEFGKPFSPAGFGNWFRDQCNAAGLKRCTAHGLRKAAARRLAEAGCSANEIAAITGHSTLKEVARYTQAADQSKLADRAFGRLFGADGEHKMSNAEKRLDKKRRK